MLRRSRLFRFFHLCCCSTISLSSPMLAHPCVLISFPSLPSPSCPSLVLSSRLLLHPPSTVLLFPPLPSFSFLVSWFGSLCVVYVSFFPRLPIVCGLPCESQCPMTLGGHVQTPQPFWLKVHIVLLRMRRPFAYVQPQLRLLPISSRSSCCCCCCCCC